MPLPSNTEHIKILLDNLNRGVLLENESGSIELANNGFCEIFDIGISPEELVGESFQKLTDRIKGSFTNPEGFLKTTENLIKEGKKVSNQIWDLKDGRVLERDFIPVIEKNKLTSAFWVYQDITEQAEHIKHIRKNTFFRDVLENMQLGMVEADTQGIIVDVTAQFCSMIGYERDDIVGKHGSELLFDSSQHAILQAETAKRAKGLPSVYELRLLRKDGSPLWAMISGAPLYDTNDQLIGSFGIHMDITQRKLDEQLLQEARQRAEQASKAKEQLMANISHEMRTPMNGIVGFTDLLLGDEHLTRQQQFYLEAIHRSANNLQLTIEDLLDFTKIEKGKLILDERPFALAKVVETLASAYQDLAKERQNKLVVNISPTLPNQLLGDPAKTGQIIKHLLVHSLRTTHKGKVVLDIVGHDEHDATHLQIRIQDTGKGYSRKELDSLFESFFVPDKGYAHAVGAGVGLAIVKRIVDRMQGRIQVDSKLGKGTVYRVDVALKRPDKKVGGKRQPQRVRKPKDVHILVAEDNEINQLLIRENLKRWDFSYELVETGAAAISELRKKNYDLVLMDIQMPDMDGLQATQVIRHEFDEPTKSIPIIALTAYALREDRERSIKAGMNDHLSKPFSPEVLLEKISTHITDYRIAINQPRKNQSEENNLQEIDLDKINLFTRGNETLRKTLISKTVSQAEQIETALSNLCQKEDWENLFKEVHRLKPNVSLMGMSKLETLIRELNEDLRHQRNLATVPNRLNQFIEGYRAAIQELQTLIK